MDIGPGPAVKMARKMGIESPLGETLSLALGSYELSPLELTSAYSVFPNMGVKVKPVMVKKILDRNGNVLEDNSERLDTFEHTRLDSETHPHFVETAAAKKDSKKNPEVSHGRPSSDPEEASEISAGDHIGPRMTRAMSPQTAYMISTILRDVGVYGTAPDISKLKRQNSEARQQLPFGAIT
jgi:penicillin-binding protein 1A